jgi:hypothetical protein
MRAPGPPGNSPENRASPRWQEGFSAVLERVDQLDPLRGASTLRRLAAGAERVSDLLAVAEAEGAALEQIAEVQDALAVLADHENTLTRLLELADLADGLDPLARAIREVLSHRDLLEWAVSEDWDSAQENPAW